MIRRRSRGRVARRPRRYVWARDNTGSTVAAATLSSSAPLANFETDMGGDLVGWRLERTIINGTVALNATSASAVNVGPLFIALYVHEVAITATMANNGSDQRSFLYFRGDTLSTTAALPAAGTGEMSTHNFHADIRARRVFRRIDEVMRMTLENSQAATQSAFFNINLSFLLSRPL